MSRRCSIRTTGEHIFCVAGVKTLITFYVLQQIEEDYASESEGESVRYGHQGLEYRL